MPLRADARGIRKEQGTAPPDSTKFTNGRAELILVTDQLLLVGGKRLLKQWLRHRSQREGGQNNGEERKERAVLHHRRNGGMEEEDRIIDLCVNCLKTFRYEGRVLGFFALFHFTKYTILFGFFPFISFTKYYYFVCSRWIRYT